MDKSSSVKGRPCLSWEERYMKLEEHHVKETQFLIDKVRELVLLID